MSRDGFPFPIIFQNSSVIGGKISYTGELMPDDENLNIIYYNDGAEPITSWQRNKSTNSITKKIK